MAPKCPTPGCDNPGVILWNERVPEPCEDCYRARARSPQPLPADCPATAPSTLVGLAGKPLTEALMARPRCLVLTEGP